MRILLINDDGVYARGIRLLRKGLEKQGEHEVFTLAPLEDRSTTGHAVTLNSPLRLSYVEGGAYGCSGHPADCFLMALGHLMKERRPDFVISGINRGANLAQDVYYSGTVAAAREAAFYGVKSMAISLAIDLEAPQNHQMHFESALEYVLRLLPLAEEILPLTLLNVNVPNLPLEEIRGLKATSLGKIIYSEEVEERVNSRGKKYYWLTGRAQGHEGPPSSDCQAIGEGFVSVTPLDLLHRYHAPDLLDKWAQILRPVSSPLDPLGPQ